jgi:hypothetical protein
MTRPSEQQRDFARYPVSNAVRMKTSRTLSYRLECCCNATALSSVSHTMLGTLPNLLPLFNEDEFDTEGCLIGFSSEADPLR